MNILATHILARSSFLSIGGGYNYLLNNELYRLCVKSDKFSLASSCSEINNRSMHMGKQKQTYETPTSETLEVKTQGVLCESHKVGANFNRFNDEEVWTN